MPKSNTQRQADRRDREKKWLLDHGFTSWEVVHTALMRERHVIGSTSSKGVMMKSPIVLKTETVAQPGMTFPEAMQAIIDGKRITKLKWDDAKIVVYLDVHLKITLPENSYKPSDLILSDGDIFGNDWRIV